MKKVLLAVLAAGMFMIGSVNAQTTPATGKPATEQQGGQTTPTDKSVKKHHRHHKGDGTKKASGGKVHAPKTDAKPTEQK